MGKIGNFMDDETKRAKALRFAADERRSKAGVTMRATAAEDLARPQARWPMISGARQRSIGDDSMRAQFFRTTSNTSARTDEGSLYGAPVVSCRFDLTSLKDGLMWPLRSALRRI